MRKRPNINSFQDIRIEVLTQTQLPIPWWQVGLTVLPGLSFLLPFPQFLGLGILIGLSLASLWLALKRKNLFDLPVWGLIPLGWFAFLAIASVPYKLDFCVMYFLLILISLPLSSKNGLSAGLFLLIGGTFAANFEVEPSIYFWDSPFWQLAISEGGLVLFMIVTPIWVLRSRTLLGQASGQLIPLAFHTAAFIYALDRENRFIHPDRFNFSFRQVIDISGPYIAQFEMLALALVTYAWIASRTFTEAE